jgi:hypothetical protein
MTARLLCYWWIPALALLASLLVFQVQRNQIIHADLRASQTKLADARSALRKTTRAATVTATVGADVERRQVVVRYVTRTLIEKVPVYVSPEVDRRYPLPVGLVRLHDSAARGEAEVPGSAGEPDDAPSDVAASTLAQTLIGNYGDYYACREQVRGWMTWAEEQKRVWNAP